MDAHPVVNSASVVQGQYMRLSARHAIAVYLRDGMHWVAEFNDGHIELTDATTWFGFHAGALRYSHAHRAAALESATALPKEVLDEIERLHQRLDAQVTEAGKGEIFVLEAAKRCYRKFASRLRVQGSKQTQQSS
jgi:hypothetical protein